MLTSLRARDLTKSKRELVEELLSSPSFSQASAQLCLAGLCCDFDLVNSSKSFTFHDCVYVSFKSFDLGNLTTGSNISKTSQI